MASNPGTANCPACGAPIASVESERCEYCGAAINTHVAAAKVAVKQVSTATRKAWRMTWLYVAVFLGFSAFMALRTQRNVEQAVQKASGSATPARPGAAASRGAARESLQLQELLFALPSADGKPALLFSSSRSPDHALYLLDPETRAVRWKSAPWSGSLGKGQVRLLGDKVIVADQTRLVALAASDGTLAWQASLVADYQPYTEGLLASGDRIAVLARDGTTQAFEASSGSTVWARKASPPPNRLHGAGGSLLEFRRVEQGRRVTDEIAVVDLGSGEVRHSLRPRCSTHSVIPAEQPSRSATLLIGPEGDEVYIFYGTFRYCAERWNLKTGAMAWQLNHANRGEQATSVAGKHTYLLGDEHIFYPAEDKALYALRRSTGELRKLQGDAETSLSPLLVQGNLLVATAVPSWESRDCGNAKQCSLWGIDVAKGTVLWRHTLPPGARMGVNTTPERVAGHIGPDGITLAQVSNDELVLDRLDPQSGVSKVHKQLKFSREIGRLAYQGDLVWLWSRQYNAVDPKTGTVRYEID
jgi:outer membrane protein assembly factor BamB